MGKWTTEAQNTLDEFREFLLIGYPDEAADIVRVLYGEFCRPAPAAASPEAYPGDYEVRETYASRKHARTLKEGDTYFPKFIQPGGEMDDLRSAVDELTIGMEALQERLEARIEGLELRAFDLEAINLQGDNEPIASFWLKERMDEIETRIRTALEARLANLGAQNDVIRVRLAALESDGLPAGFQRGPIRIVPLDATRSIPEDDPPA